MTKYNHSFAKMVNGLMEWAPIPLTVVYYHHHEEWDEPVFDPETGEPVIDPETGEQKTERKSRDWDTSRTELHPTADDYHAMGYKDVADKPPSDPAPEGYHWEAKGWNEGEDKFVRVYEAVENPPRTFSKIDLEAAVFKRGLLDKLDAFVDAQTITNEFGDTMPLRRAYNTAKTFREDHPLFAPYLVAAKQALGVDDTTAEAILAAAVVEEV